MIEKLYKLGKLIPEEKLEYNIYRLELDEYYDRNKNRPWDVIVLNFNLDGDGNVEFSGSEVRSYRKQDNLKYWFFKKPSAPNAVSEFPTIDCRGSDLRFKVEDSSEELKSRNKCLKKLLRILNNCRKIEPELKPVYDYFNEKPKAVLERLKTYSDDRTASYVLTILINGESVGKSSLFSKVREQTEKKVFKEFYTLNQKEVIKKDKVCSVCLQEKAEIWGFPTIFNFYAAKTELAPIAGGFNKRDSWKNYSICPQCALLLDKTKYFIRKKLSYRFCGLNYFLIPEFLDDNRDFSEFEEVLNIFFDRETALGQFGIRNNREYLTQNEDEVLDIIKECNNRVNYTLFFYEQDQAKFTILLNIEDIYPSYFREIFKAKEEAEKHEIFEDIKGIYKKGDIDDLRFSFELVKLFLPFNNKIANYIGDFSKSFLEVVRNVFLQKKIDYKYLIKRMIYVTRYYYVNDHPYRHLALRSFLVLNFFQELKILGKSNIEDKEVQVSEQYQNFFEEFSGFFDCNAKKAVFLEGVLCQHLLDIQYRERGSTPFRRKLKGLKLNPKTVRRLFPETIEKLEQYRKNYYRKLEREIASLMVASDIEKLSNDELSYYFVLGMSLNNRFKTEEEEKNDN